jgi:hypothetical protein
MSANSAIPEIFLTGKQLGRFAGFILLTQT